MNVKPYKTNNVNKKGGLKNCYSTNKRLFLIKGKLLVYLLKDIKKTL